MATPPFIFDLDTVRQEKARLNEPPRVRISTTIHKCVLFEVEQAGMLLRLSWVLSPRYAERMALALLHRADPDKFQRMEKALALAGISLGIEPEVSP